MYRGARLADHHWLLRMLCHRIMIRYPIGVSGQFIVVSKPVLRHFRRHRQLARRDREAGGQLFARFDTPFITVVEATGPRKTDLRTRTSYTPDRAAERAEITQRT